MDADSETQVRVDDLVLQLEDFPSGWRASPAEEQEGPDYTECAEVPFDLLTEDNPDVRERAESDTFTEGELPTVSSAAGVYGSEQEAEEALAERAEGMRSIDRDCVRDQLHAAIDDPEEEEVTGVDVGELSLDPLPVDEARAWEFAVSIESYGFLETLYVNTYVLRQGDAMVTLGTQDLGPFDEELREELLATLAERLQGGGR